MSGRSDEQELSELLARDEGTTLERVAVARTADCAMDEAQALPKGEVRSLLEELSSTLRRLAVVRPVPDDQSGG